MKSKKRGRVMLRRIQDSLRVFALVLAGLMLLVGPVSCSKEEIRRTLPGERSF